MSATRKLSAHELGLVVLSLLTEKARYGSEIADCIEQLSQHFYRPSSGILYPMLADLTEQGHISQERQGRRKFYALTPQGEGYLAEHRAAANSLYQRLQRAGHKLYQVQKTLSQSVASPAQMFPMAHELVTARMDLKAAMYETRQLPLAAQEEVLTILRETAERIRSCTQRYTK